MGYSPMESGSVDIKFMPKHFDDFKYLLEPYSEITNFLLTVSNKSRAAQDIAETLINRVSNAFSPPKLLIVNKDSAFTKVAQLLLQTVNCQLKIICPFDHGILRTVNQIQTVGKMTIKHPTRNREMWPLYTTVAAYAMNTFESLALSGFSSFE